MARAKFISPELYKKSLVLLPKLPRKSSIEEVWDLIYDKIGMEAKIAVTKKSAVLTMLVSGEISTLERDPKEIIVVDKWGNTQEERYDLLLLDGINKILDEQLYLPKNKRSKKISRKKSNPENKKPVKAQAVDSKPVKKTTNNKKETPEKIKKTAKTVEKPVSIKKDVKAIPIKKDSKAKEKPIPIKNEPKPKEKVAPVKKDPKPKRKYTKKEKV